MHMPTTKPAQQLQEQAQHQQTGMLMPLLPAGQCCTSVWMLSWQRLLLRSRLRFVRPWHLLQVVVLMVLQGCEQCCRV